MECDSKKAFIILVTLLLTLLVTRPIDNFDVWWHLHSGIWMLMQGHVLDIDLWSFTQSGSHWLNMAWFFQVIIAIAYKLGDIWGLLVFKAIVIFTIFWLIALSTRSPRNMIAYVIAFLILLPAIYGHLHLRPHLFELAALALLIYISQKPWDIRYIFISLLVLLVWANSHASVVVGSVAFTLQCLFGRWSNVEQKRTRLFIALLFLATPFFTPYGFEILNLLVVHGGSDVTNYYIMEWLPHNVYPLGLWLVFLTVLLFALNKTVRISPAEWFLLTFFLCYSIKFQRFELEFGVLLLRPLSEVIGYSLSYLNRQSVKLPTLVSILIILIHGLIYEDQIRNLAPSLYADAPYNRFRYPDVTLVQLNYISMNLDRNVKVINDYDYGGFISFFTEGTSKVFIDGRMSTIFPESLLIPPYETDPRVLKLLAQRYDVDAILLKLNNSKVLSLNDAEWQMIGYDAASVLYIRRSIVDILDLPHINYDPSKYDNAYKQEQLESYKKATTKLLEFKPENPVALNHMATFLTNDIASTRSLHEALRYFEKSAQLNPNDMFSRATYAYLIATRSSDYKNDMAEYFKYLPPANKLTTGINLSYDLTFARLLIEQGLPHIALDYLYPADKIRRFQIDKLIDTWKYRVIVHNELQEHEKAMNCLDIAYELVDQSDALQRHELDQLNQIIGKSKVE